MCRRGRSRHRRQRRTHATARRKRARHQESFQSENESSVSENALPSVLSRSLPGGPADLRIPDLRGRGRGARFARSYAPATREAPPSHGGAGGRTEFVLHNLNLLLVRSSVLAPSPRAAAGGKVRLSFTCNLIILQHRTCTQSRARMWPPLSLSIVSAAQARAFATERVQHAGAHAPWRPHKHVILRASCL